MTDNSHAAELPRWPRSRYGFAAFFFFSLIAGWIVLRLVLFLGFKPAGLPRSEITAAFQSGLQRDCLAGMVLILPLLVWMLLIPERWLVTRRRCAQRGRRRERRLLAREGGRKRPTPAAG
jgi:hypothetical protein